MKLLALLRHIHLIRNPSSLGLFLWKCIFNGSLGIRRPIPCFTSRSTARLNIIPCILHANISSLHWYCTRQFRTDFLVPNKSRWTNYSTHWKFVEHPASSMLRAMKFLVLFVLAINMVLERRYQVLRSPLTVAYMQLGRFPVFS